MKKSKWWFVDGVDKSEFPALLIDCKPRKFAKINYFFSWKLPEYWYNIKYVTKKLIFPKKAQRRDITIFPKKICKISIPVIEKYLHDLKNNPDKYGFCPGCFSEHIINSTEDKEQNWPGSNDKFYVGGGFDKWVETVEKILFALEYYYSENIISSKESDAFYKKYYGATPWDEIPENITRSYWYWIKEPKDDLSHWCTCAKEIHEDGYELRIIEENYYNYKMIENARERAQEGMMLFGRYLPWIW